MGIICIDERVWTSLMGKLKSLSALAREVERQYDPTKRDVWIDSQEVCVMLGITKRTLQSYRDKRFVPYTNVGGKYFYRESDVAAYLEARTVRKAAAVERINPQAEPNFQPQKK